MEEFEINYECWEAWQVFSACQTQWIYAGMAGVVTGLNYAGVEAVLRIHDVLNPETFELVRAAEMGWLWAKGDNDLDDLI